MTEPGWDEARSLAREQTPLPVAELALTAAVGTVLVEDALAPAPVPHYDSAAMDGWAVAGPPPWRLQHELTRTGAIEVVTGGLVPASAEAVVPMERASVSHGEVTADAPAPGAHIRRAGEEAPAGAVLVAAGTRLTPAHAAVLGIAGLDAVRVRRRPTVAVVLTGDEVVRTGRPGPGRVRDAFEPLLPAAIHALGGAVLRLVRTGDDERAIAAAVDGPEDLVVTVGGTGRSRADRLRRALGGAPTAFDGVAMRPGHPTLLTRARRPVLGLPGNPLAAVTALLSFLPPILDGFTAAPAAPPSERPAAIDLPGWRGTSLIPCSTGPVGLHPAEATRPNMLRGLAASDVLAVVPPEGASAGTPVRILPLPW